MRFTKRGTSLCLILMLASLSASAKSPDAISSEIEDLDSVVAVVNEDVIVRSELNQQTRMITAQLAEKGARLPPRSILEKQVLERLIATRLQLQAAERAGITVDDKTLARAIGNIAEKNGVSLSELRDALEADGLSFAQFRENIRREIITTRLRHAQVDNRIVVTDQELENYLKSENQNLSERTAFHLLHILVATPEGASSEKLARAKRKAEGLVDRLRQGADFGELALTYSDGRNALEGGDLGWLTPSQIPSIAVDLVNSLNKGEISDPIRSSSGYHIVKLVDFKGPEQQIVVQTLAQHILLNTNELVSDDDARIRLEQLRERLEGGEDFATLARSHSDDKASAIKGGDLGWVNKGDLVPRFEEQMESLAIGEISQPFRTQFGWHIVKVNDRRRHDNTRDAVENKARDAIRQRKSVEATMLWLRRLRDEAYVEIRDDY